MKEICIEEKENLKKIYLIENNQILEKQEESAEKPMLEGNIYIGKVQNVIPGMQAAFINIGSNKNVFIHLRDIMPKVDVTLENTKKENHNIKEFVKSGEPILVQVTRDNNYKKGARVTKHISITGRFFVYMPSSPFVTVSQKIEDENKKEELKKILKEILSEEDGGIVRTSAANATKQEISDDVHRLLKKWDDIKNSQIDDYPKEIYNAGGIVKKYILDHLDKNLDRIICTSNLENIVQDIMNQEDKNIPIVIDEEYMHKFDFDRQIRKLENRKIWLDCGGFITIDRTEALTAIDVNSGKFIGKNDFEDTVFKVNEEATVEIAKQIRARDIGGIIVIDYIDMHLDENKEKIINLLKKEIKKDSSKVQIEGFTKLNLLEMTRKHVYSS